MLSRELCTLDDARHALEFISPDCDRDSWVRMGMAVKSEFGSVGYDLWDRWSAGAESYKPADAKATWKSIKATGVGGSIGIGTLFKQAKQNGWKPSAAPLTLEQEQALRKDAEERRLKREAEAIKAAEQQARKVADVKQRAAKIWDSLPVEGFSDYLNYKKVRGWGVRFSRGSMVIPVRTLASELVGLQFIPAVGDKKFLTGTQKQGNMHVIGDIDPSPCAPLCVSEGYATAASIYEATGIASVVAFDSANLKPVALALREKYPQAWLVICGDDDKKTPGNPGRAKATEAAFAVNGRVVFPEFGEEACKP